MTKPNIFAPRGKLAPKMERRHYVYIAEIIQELEISAKQRKKLALDFAAKLMRTNNNFKYSKFVEYATAKSELN